MLETFHATLSPMLMLFFCILVGVVMNKSKLAPEETVTVLSKLEANVLVPVLCFNTFMNYCTVASIRENYRLILYCAGILAVGVPLAIVLSDLFTRKPYQRRIYQYALAFGNFGFMGNAVIQVMFGDETLYRYLLFTLLMQVVANTWGVTILTPKERRTGSFLKNLTSPIFICILLGAILGLTGLSRYIPVFLTNAASSLASCMGPIAMILTGFVIGDYDMGELLFRNKRVYLATFLRLVLLPGLFMLGMRALGAKQMDMVMMLCAFATPLGLNTVVFPAAFGGETHTGAAMAIISHSLSILTLPLMYALAQLLAS